MADPTQADRWLYGSAALAALVAGGVAVWNAVGAEPTTVTPEAEAPAPAPSEARPSGGAVTFGDAGPELSTRVGPDFVPDLPEVPNLETDPPDAPPPSDDPRMEQLGAEMRILSRARELLDDHPSEALGVLEQHRRRYAAGVLREERDAFVIEALLALEHVDEAERRYYDFLSDYPESAFRERLRQAMMRPPHDVGAGGGR